MNVCDLDCDEIAGKAKELSRSAGHEDHRARQRQRDLAHRARRCAAAPRRRWSDNASTPVYVRAYEEGENRMVAYQATPFE